jgi:hypothetical protein
MNTYRLSVNNERLAFLFLVIAAALCNAVLTGFAQDAAYRSYESAGRDATRYGAVGSVVVPLAAEHTSIQLAGLALPLLVAAVARLRRWPSVVTLAMIVGCELLTITWCAMAHEFARTPFVAG